MEEFKVKYRPQFEVLYKNAVKEIKPEDYLLIYPKDSLANILCPPFKNPFVAAVISTSLCTVADLQYNDLMVLKGSQFVHERFYRSCDHNEQPHLNSNDLLLFPDSKGDIAGISRSDSPDHYIALMKKAGLEDIIQNFHLPKEKFGHVNSFTAGGATIPSIINFKPITSTQADVVVNKGF